ncbi:Two-component response regulator [Halomicronema hongdechloris C2206]|uniref:Two-component response regulator n=1 Tax=Halomicronema hongdechloris C2206 TaxID=1641165 RepID=A0A1Z3HPH6_9CYAN|nr:SpoIIE family protein phosphatase [Halomicronema hongdechloris]ASC72214.1 Two-component response regulator [Halomicronema hongdechloris C2206]
MSLGQGDKLKLMVVDDEPDNLDLLYRTFRREFQVFKAANGFEALDILAQQGEMAVIISDQRMPRMNGTEFLSRTVAHFPDTIRIVLTGYTDVDDLVEAINSGKVFKYITKPWNPENLKTVVLQAADTYKVVKQRTKALTQALRRESVINTVLKALRESLDYASMLHKVVQTLGDTCDATHAILHPIPALPTGLHDSQALESGPYAYQAKSPLSSELQAFLLEDSRKRICLEPEQLQANLASLTFQGLAIRALTLPLIYQQNYLAVVVLYQIGSGIPWSSDTLGLVEGITEQIALAISQAQLYQHTRLQTHQMQTELAVARQIQANLLRQQLPVVNGVRIQARCLPAREVGGDFFEVYCHPQGDLWLAVGDVSGKGVPAALFMASALSVLRRELAQATPAAPYRLMQTLNQSLSMELVSNNCFITLVLVRYVPTTGQVIYANAGHIYPMVWSDYQGQGQAPAKPPHPNYLEQRGVPLGILPEWNGQVGEYWLRGGDTLLLASDGLTDATVTVAGTTDSQATLKQVGLWQLLQQQAPPLNLDHLLSTIQALNVGQVDDQTVLSLEVLAP